MEKIMMEIITPINAIMSWEGYEIQGHIALYVALGKIKENIYLEMQTTYGTWK